LVAIVGFQPHRTHTPISARRPAKELAAGTAPR
jgi:hypothetical protein